jgi:hypothetical protein
LCPARQPKRAYSFVKVPLDFLPHVFFAGCEQVLDRPTSAV